MPMAAALILVLLCISGFILFRKNTLGPGEAQDGETRVSVIIPARNEEANLPVLLASLKKQTLEPFEIIVCDDHSEDSTCEIAKSFGVTVIHSPPLPENWTGKNWAVWNGFSKSSGDVLVFLDADVALEERALEALINKRAETGGVISVVPFHRTVKFCEKLSLLLYMLGVLVFTSPFERKNRVQGLYGSCIVALRADYEKISGHSSVSSELLDDLNLGKRFVSAGVEVRNYIGCGYVSFRMYHSLRGMIDGFGKGAVLSTANLSPATLFFTVAWIVGLLASGFGAPILLLAGHDLGLYFLAAYLIYALQILYFLRYTGQYGYIMPIFHLISSAFFILIIIYSAYRVVFIGSVVWKGRVIKVGKTGR